MKILVTGAAGFIGYHLCARLLKEGHEVIGLDNINDYYDVNLKYARLKELGVERSEAENFNEITSSKIYNIRFQFIRLNLEDRKNLPSLFEKHKIEVACNLAAQAGVRYSLENPEAYVDSNITGFLNLLECCRNHQIKHLVYASSSSVYGQNKEVPFSEKANVDNPVSLYAATKKANELMASTYSHLYNFKTTGLRFFTVYGPWGRPDMAMFLFTNAMLKGEPIKVFNNGNLERDFTFIDDIIEGVSKILNREAEDTIHSVYNIGNNNPIKLLDFIKEIEEQLGLTAQKKMMPMQSGDVDRTWADVASLQKDFDYNPSTSVERGIKEFIKWYKQYYKIKTSSSGIAPIAQAAQE